MFTLVAVATVFGLGCGATKAYTGPEQPENAVATLESCGVCVVASLDGAAPPESTVGRWEILPGKHRVDVSSNEGEDHQDPIPLNFLAKAGQTYRVGLYQVQEDEVATEVGPAFYSLSGAVVVEGGAGSNTCFFSWGRIEDGQVMVDPGVRVRPESKCPEL